VRLVPLAGRPQTGLPRFKEIGDAETQQTSDGVIDALAVAAQCGASTPFAKLPVGQVSLALLATGPGLLGRRAGAWQLRHPVARQIIVFRVTTTLAFAAGLLFPPLSSSQTSDGRPPANEFVRQIIDNELQAEKNDHSHWMLRLETRKSGTTEVREVVETKDGDLDWLISVNGKPLPEHQRRERERGLRRLISNPAELKKSQREKDEDQVRSQRLLKLLPDALVFEYGEQRGDLVELKFKSNPRFRPPSHEAAVVHAMEGLLWVNRRQKRLVEISGHLTRPVKFGGGILGHLDSGGHFYVKQEEVQPGYWELTVLDVDMKGKALFFKTIGVSEEMKRSTFRRVRDDLTAAQGANLLYQQMPTTSRSNSERHSTDVLEQQAPP
jgi:hypothetical protein